MVRFHNLLLKVATWFSQFHKLRFKKWITLEEQKNRVVKAVAESSDTFPQEMFTFLSTALSLPVQYFQDASWENIIQSFYKTVHLTQSQISLPILTPSNEKVKDDPWTYDNRLWHLYSHMLAKSYGWTLDYIANLSVQEVLPKVQEILTDDQLEKEFWWGLSEKSVSYDNHTQTAHFQPLPRPEWMKQSHKHIEAPQIAKVPENLRPMGVGITYEQIAQGETSYVQ